VLLTYLQVEFRIARDIGRKVEPARKKLNSQFITKSDRRRGKCKPSATAYTNEPMMSPNPHTTFSERTAQQPNTGDAISARLIWSTYDYFNHFLRVCIGGYYDKKRFFLSFDSDDIQQIRGLRLLAANPNYDLAFYDESLKVLWNVTNHQLN
jgi:hypothetical protein